MSKYINTSMLIVGLAIGTLVPLFALDLTGDATVPEEAAPVSTASQPDAVPYGVELAKDDAPTAFDEQIEILLFGVQEAIASVTTAVSGAFTLEGVSSSTMSSNSRENIRFTGGAKFVSVK